MSSNPYREKTPPDRKIKPPPNYSSRKVQFRLMLLVAVFMTVLVALPFVGDPSSYNFMGFKKAPLTDDEIADENPSTKLEDVESPGDRDTIIVAPPKVNVAEKPVADPYAAALQDGWANLFDKITADERGALAEALYLHRHGEEPPTELQSSLLLLIVQIDAVWNEYLSDARSRIDEDESLSDEEGDRWRGVLDRLAARWAEEKAALSTLAAAEGELTESQSAALRGFAETYDLHSLAIVEDKTLHRNEEQDAWFRFFEQLQDADAEELKSEAPRVGFLQVFKQPESYRGKPVTIRGTAHLVYRVNAPDNVCGIDHYYIYWIRPAGGPDSPFVVYALGTPEGFPRVREKSSDQDDNVLNEDVEFTGYFFKNYAYSAKEGVLVAPLFLADTPGWTSRPLSSSGGLPSWWMVALIVAGAAIIAIAVAVSVFVVSRRMTAGNDEIEPTTADFESLKKEPLATPFEAMQAADNAAIPHEH